MLYVVNNSDVCSKSAPLLLYATSLILTVNAITLNGILRLKQVCLRSMLPPPPHNAGISAYNRSKCSTAQSGGSCDQPWPIMWTPLLGRHGWWVSQQVLLSMQHHFVWMRVETWARKGQDKTQDMQYKESYRANEVARSLYDITKSLLGLLSAMSLVLPQVLSLLHKPCITMSLYGIITFLYIYISQGHEM